MKNRIITISREFGSGGRTVGKQVAEKLGIPCYDHELIDKIAEESGFAKEYIKEQSEYTNHSNWFVNSFTDAGFIGTGYSNQDYIWTIQRKIILDLAEKSSCVIVGRCADYILSDVADCLKVFIYSDFEKRAERIVKVYGETDEPTTKRLKDKDKRRASYYQFYTDMKWGETKNYDVCLNSGVLGIDKCVDVVASLY